MCLNQLVRAFSKTVKVNQYNTRLAEMTKCILLMPMKTIWRQLTMAQISNRSQDKSSMSANSQTISIEQLPSLPLLLGKAAFKSGSYGPGDELPNLQIRVEQFNLDRVHLHLLTQHLIRTRSAALVLPRFPLCRWVLLLILRNDIRKVTYTNTII